MTAPAARAGAGGVVAGLAGTTVAHGLLLVALLLAWQEREPLGTVYAVRLIAATPPPPDLQRLAEEAAPRPQERTAPVDRPSPAARPVPQPARTVPQPRREPLPATRSATQPLPGETPMGGTDVANISTPGVEFPFPEYLRHLMNEIYRRWERPATHLPLRVEIRFHILRDGTVRDIHIATRSRDIRFDLRAQGAVEAAARAGSFGPLPEGFPGDVLALSVWFTPRGTP